LLLILASSDRFFIMRDRTESRQYGQWQLRVLRVLSARFHAAVASGIVVATQPAFSATAATGKAGFKVA
jgi:hypothetical protein